jgi:hypothetical protein
MKAGMRRTEAGIEIPASTLRWLGALIALLGTIAGVGAKVYVKADRIDNAVQLPEFRDSTKSLRDTTIALRRDLEVVKDVMADVAGNVLAMNCHSQGYPSPFCDKVTRQPAAAQAGQARRTP